VEYIKMGIRKYSSMKGKEKLYEDLKAGRSTTSTPTTGRRSRRVSVDTSGTPVMAGKVDRRKDAVAKTTTKKDSRKTKTAKFGVGSSKTIMHKGRSMLNVTADQLKKTGLTQTEYMKAWNKTGKRPTKATTTARRGNAVPGIRTGDTTPRIDAPIHTALKRQILSKKPAMTKAEARKAKITGPREMTKAEARKAGITGPKKVTGSAYLRRRQKEIKSRKLSGGGIIRGTRAQVRGRTFKGVF